MIESIKQTDVYKSLKLNKLTSHAYLFFSFDAELNNNVALNFAKTLVCNQHNGCGKCNPCKQFDSNSHPDVFIVDQPQIKVEDANQIIEKLATKPISAKHKLIVILNAENMNEIAQNKLLKSFEEPNESVVFILTCAKTDKLLPTILSRLNKVYVPKLSRDDIKNIESELNINGVDISHYTSHNLTLTEIMNFSTNSNYIDTLTAIKNLFSNLNSSQDIPLLASNLGEVDKALFLPILQNIFLECLHPENRIDLQTVEIFKQRFNEKTIIHCLPLIEKAYKMQMANVNFSFILDNLLFNILKEKYLCK